MTGGGTARTDHGRDRGEDRHHRSHDRAAGARFLRQGSHRCGAGADLRIADWEPHLARMCAFWSSVALMSGRYHGTPMAQHTPLPVDADHFDRWLALFEETAREISPPAAAAHFV